MLFTYRWTGSGNICIKSQQTGTCRFPRYLKTTIALFLKSCGRTTGIQIRIVLLFLLGLSLDYLSCLLLGSHYLFQVQGTIPVFPSPYFLLPEVSPLSAHAIQFLNLLFWFRCSSRPSMHNTKDCWSPFTTPMSNLHFFSIAKIARSIWLLQNAKSHV